MELYSQEETNNNPRNRVAYFLSAITHPLLVPVLGFFVLNKYNTTTFNGKSLYLMLLVFTITVVGLPAYFVFAMKRSGYIESYEMEHLKERRIPLMFTAAVMLFNYFLMQRSGIPAPFPAYFLSLCSASLVAFCISLFYKISLHTLGAGFLFGLGLVMATFSMSDLRWYLIFCTLGGGIIAYCRLILNAHTLPQIYSGFLTGMLCACAMFMLI